MTRETTDSVENVVIIEPGENVMFRTLYQTLLAGQRRQQATNAYHHANRNFFGLPDETSSTFCISPRN